MTAQTEASESSRSGADIPYVSVLLQTYRHERFVSRAIEGVLEQECPFAMELIVAEDCSPDRTREVVRSWAGRDPRVRLVLPERNLGANELFRQAFGEVRGRYLAWLDGDDYWTDAGKLRRQLELLERHPDWATCFHDAEVVYEDGSRPARPYVPHVGREVFGLEDILAGDFIPTASMMCRPELLRDLPEWALSARWTDWLTKIVLAQHGALGYLPEVMSVYRLHSGGLAGGLERAEQIAEDLRVYAMLAVVLPAENHELIRRFVRNRLCQLAVERAELPYDQPVLVLGESGEAPTYLNGRDVWPVAGGETPLHLRDAAELRALIEQLRARAPHQRSTHRHFGALRPMPESSDGRFGHLLIAKAGLDGLAWRAPLLSSLAESYRRVWDDDGCAIFDLSSRRPTTDGGAAEPPATVEVERVVLHEPLPQELHGRHVDRPKPGTLSAAGSIELIGWAIGRVAPAVSVEAVINGTVVGTAPVTEDRPDLAAAFPKVARARSSGFRTTLDVARRQSRMDVELRAVLEDEARVPLGTLTVRWRLDEGA